MQIQLSRFSVNKTLYGLRTNTAVRIKFDSDSYTVVEIIGVPNISVADAEVSESTAFNIPQFISIEGLPYFPSKYEFSEGIVWYHARRAPDHQIRLVTPYGALSERAKIVNARITPQMLSDFDKPARLRPRDLRQSQVMGESARAHAQQLIDNGDLIIPPGSSVQWHWCHLIAYTMLPEHRCQIRRNLFVGTSACNGHMANIEAAVKLFIYETQRPVSLEVTVTVLADTHVGRRIRYQMWEPRSQTLYREYFDALTETQSDYADFELIHRKLMDNYQSNLSGKGRG